MTKLNNEIHELAIDELKGVSGGTTTIGGTALGRGRVITNGGANTNLARGFGSTATQTTPPLPAGSL
jgi:hypothetical protein